MRYASEEQHAATQPTGATIVWLGVAGLLAGVALVLPTWVLGAALMVGLFVALCFALVCILARIGDSRG
jgi:hypothetical protein